MRKGGCEYEDLEETGYHRYTGGDQNAIPK